MRDRAALLAYLAAVVLVTTVHDPRLLAAGIVVAGIVAWHDCLRVAKRAGLAILLFNTVVTVSYVILSAVRGELSLRFVLLVNLRVFLLTYMTFLLHRRINPFRALAFSKTLLYLIVLAYGQIVTFQRLLADSRLALRSRSLARPRLRDLYRHGAATAVCFLGKSLGAATEITQAMSARGFFHDQG
jgi:cobalt/nickel transport system permease protein